MADVKLSIIDTMGVAADCGVPWDSMPGDSRTRYCEHCKLNVHNISNMTRQEAEAFLQRFVDGKVSSEGNKAGRLCVDFYRRSDGTILTQDCPVGLAKLKRKARLAAARAVLAVGTLVATVWASAGLNKSYTQGPRVNEMEPFITLAKWLAPGNPVPPMPNSLRMMRSAITWPPPRMSPTELRVIQEALDEHEDAPEPDELQESPFRDLRPE